MNCGTAEGPTGGTDFDSTLQPFIFVVSPFQGWSHFNLVPRPLAWAIKFCPVRAGVRFEVEFAQKPTFVSK
jgi:hypothetical protein